VGLKELGAHLLSRLTESRGCWVKEQRDPIGTGTFYEEAFQSWFHDHGDPSTSPRRKSAVGTPVGKTGIRWFSVRRFRLPGRLKFCLTPQVNNFNYVFHPEIATIRFKVRFNFIKSFHEKNLPGDSLPWNRGDGTGDGAACKLLCRCEEGRGTPGSDRDQEEY
jgi:hypothetical protein